MDPAVKKDTTPNEVYVNHYKDFIRLMRIAKMLQNARITKNGNPTQNK
jgi:hypothetical protein